MKFNLRDMVKTKRAVHIRIGGSFSGSEIVIEPGTIGEVVSLRLGYVETCVVKFMINDKISVCADMYEEGLE